MKKILSVLTAACLCASMVPSAALAAGSGPDGEYTQKDINEMAQLQMSPFQGEDDGSATASTLVRAIVGNFIDFRATLTANGAASGSASQVKDTTFAVATSGGTAPYTWEWTVTEWATDDPDAKTQLSNDSASWRTSVQAADAVTPYALADDVDAGVLRNGYTYQYQVTVTDKAGNRCTSDPINVVISQSFQDGQLFYPDNPADYDVSVKGSFAPGAQLIAPAADAATIDKIKTQLADGRAIAGTWALSVTREGQDAVGSISDVYVEISRELYESVIASSTEAAPCAFIVGYEGDKTVRYPITASKNVAFTPEGDIAQAEHIYVRFSPTENPKAAGTYALVYDVADNMKASVTAVLPDGAGGQITPVGTTLYPVLEGQPGQGSTTVRYTFLPFDGYKVGAMSVTDVTDGGSKAVAPAVTGANFVEFAATSSHEYQVTGTFDAVPENAEVQHSVFACAKAAEGAKGVGTASIMGQDNPASFAEGSAVTVALGGTNVVLQSVQLAEVSQPITGALSDAELDALTWTEAASVGNTYTIPALTANTVVRLIYADGKSEQASVKVTGTASAYGQSTALKQGKNELDFATIDLKDATPQMGQMVSLSITLKDEAWSLTGATLTMRDPKAAADAEPLGVCDVLASVRDGSLTFGPAVCDYDIALEFSHGPVSLTFTGDENGITTVTDAAGDPIDPGAVEYGSVVAVTFTPNAGYTVGGVKAKGGELIDQVADTATGAVTAHVRVTGNTELIVDYVPQAIPTQAYVVADVRASAGGTVSPQGTGLQVLRAAGKLVVGVRPDAGYKVDSIFVNGEEAEYDPAAGSIAVEFADDVDQYSVFVQFSKLAEGEPEPEKPAASKEHSITVDAGQNGSVTPGGTFTVVEGNGASLSIIADTGYVIGSVSVRDERGAAVELPKDFAYADQASAVLPLDDMISGKAGRNLTVAVQFKAQTAFAQDYYKLTTSVGAGADAGNAVTPAGITSVLAGTAQDIQFLNAAGWRLKAVNVTAGGVTSNRIAYVEGGVLPLTMTADTQVVAEFEQVPGGSGDVPAAETVDVRVEQARGGSVSPSGTVPVLKGAGLALTFTEESGYEFQGVSIKFATPDASGRTTEVIEVGDDRISRNGSGSRSYAFMLPAADVQRGATVTGLFKEQTGTGEVVETYHMVTTQVEGEGEVSPASAKVLPGEDRTLTFIPAAGMDLQSVTVARFESDRTPAGTEALDVQAIKDADYTLRLTDVRHDTVVTARFAPAQGQVVTPETITGRAQVLTVGGSVSPESQQVAHGTRADFTVLPDARSHFASAYYVLDGQSEQHPLNLQGDGTLSVTASADFTLYVSFEADPADDEHQTYPVTANKVIEDPGAGYELADGTISPSGTVQVAAGGNATFTFMPEKGAVAQIRTAGNSDWRTCTNSSFTFFRVYAPASLDVRFVRYTEQNPEPQPEVNTVFHSIDATVAAAGGGSIAPATQGGQKVMVAEGASASFTLKPDKGYKLSHVVVDGQSIPATSKRIVRNQYTFSAVAADHSIQAHFVKEEAPVPKFCEVVVRGAEGGTVTLNGQEAPSSFFVEQGKTVELELRADYGYVIDRENLTLGGKAVQFGTGGNTINDAGTVARLAVGYADAPRVLQAAFAKGQSSSGDAPVYTTVQVKQNAGGTVTPQTYLAVVGSEAPFSFVPAEGKKLARVTLTDADGNPIYVSGMQEDFAPAIRQNGYKYTFTVVPGMTVQVEFADLDVAAGDEPVEVVTHQVTVKKTGKGYVRPLGSKDVVDGGSLGLTLAAHQGWRLSKVSVDGVDRTGDVTADGTFLLEGVTRDASVQVDFVQKGAQTVKIPVSVPSVPGQKAGGSVTTSPDGTVTAEVGGSLPISMNPDDGYKVAELVVVRRGADGQEKRETVKEPGTEYAISPVTADMIGIEVRFAREGNGSGVGEGNGQTYDRGRVTTSVEYGNGTIEPMLDGVEMLVGNSMGLQLKPAEGYQVERVSVDGQQVASGSATTQYVFTMPSVGDHSVTVAFKKKDPAEEQVEVSVEVKAELSVSSSVGASLGGTVTPTQATVDKGGSHAFYVFPDENFDVAGISYTTSDGAVRQVTDLRYLDADELEQAASSAEGRSLMDRVFGIFALGRIVPAGDRTDDTAGYVFDIHDIQDDIVVDVEFVDAPGTTWGARDTAVVSHNGGGLLSPSGTVTMPSGAGMTLDYAVTAFDTHHLAHLWLTDADGKRTDIKGRVSGNRVRDLTLYGGWSLSAEFEENDDTVQVDIAESVYDGSTLVASVSPSGQLTAKKGGSQTFTFTKQTDLDKRVSKVLVDYPDGRHAEYDVPEGSATFTLFNLEEGMRVSFQGADGHMERAEAFTVTPKVGAGPDGQVHGRISPDKAFEYAKGASQTFEFMPDDDAVIAGVTIAPSDVDDSAQHVLTPEEWAGGSYTVRGISQDMTVTVVFKKVVTYTISFGSSEGGSLSHESGVSGRLEVAEGQAVRLRVTPDEGWRVDSVVYTPGARAVARSAGDGISPQADGGRTLAVKDGAVEFTAVEDAHVQGNFARVNAPVEDPDDPNANSFVVKASAGEHGSIVPEGDVSVKRGQDVTFQIKPDTGYQLKSLKVDGQDKGAGHAQWVFRDVQEGHTIHAEFEAATPPGPNSPADRVVRYLQSLAATGDGAVAVVLGLLAVAFAALGISLMSARRNRRHGSHKA